jgi:hypothetical protein
LLRFLSSFGSTSVRLRILSESRPSSFLIGGLWETIIWDFAKRWLHLYISIYIYAQLLCLLVYLCTYTYTYMYTWHVYIYIYIYIYTFVYMYAIPKYSFCSYMHMVGGDYCFFLCVRRFMELRKTSCWHFGRCH